MTEIEQFENVKTYTHRSSSGGGEYLPHSYMTECKEGKNVKLDNYEILLEAYKELKYKLEGLEK